MFHMPPRFHDRSAIVSGAGSGIGRAAATRLAAEGARVLCADLDGAAAEATAAALREAGGQAIAVACDVTQPQAITDAVATAVARHGRLHALVNCAGTGHFRRTTEETLEGWSRILAVNLTGTFLFCKEALPHLLETRGAIVNTASVAGLKSHPYAAAYCASKGGVVMLSRALAVEYGRKGVRVNSICPGRVETPLLGQFGLPEGASPKALMRLMPLREESGTPAEVAALIAFLASDEASYINGAVIEVSGGMSV
jgi:meso-butanediol dehydrogenase/(S,S)-butanediol dehydrogenase/diacetyl reductase